jgi:RNase P subunit RPR2
VDAYCVKCKAKTEIKNPKEIIMKNGRPAITGTCSKCGTKVFKILPKK